MVLFLSAPDYFYQYSSLKRSIKSTHVAVNDLVDKT